MKNKLVFREQQLIVECLQGTLKDTFGSEALKGCDPQVYGYPVELESPFQSYRLSEFLRQKNKGVCLTPKPIRAFPDKVFLRLWFSTHDDLEWTQFETVLRELSIVESPISFLIVGNSKRISCELGVEKEDEMPLRHTLTSKFPNMQIDTNSESCFRDFYKKTINDFGFDFRDFVPPPPYWHNTINYDSIKNATTLLAVYSTLSSIPEGRFGFYQVIFQKASPQWKDNILNLIEGEFESSRYASIRQNLTPSSGFGSEVFREARKKLEGPHFAASLRIGAFCEKSKIRGTLESLNLAVSGAQYSDRQFFYLTKKDYLKVMQEKELVEAFEQALVRRPGMILTAQELSALFSFGSRKIVERSEYPIDNAVGFRAVKQFTENDGVIIGINSFAGKETIIRQPERIRTLHTSLGGLIGKGKSYQLEGMVLSDIERGKGVGVIDPHGDLIERVIRQIPEHRVKDCIYFSPCEPSHALCYNPFSLDPGQDIGKKADDLIVSLRSLFPSNEWGHLIESTLMVVFYTLLKGDNLCLADARILLSKTEEGYSMREKLVPQIDNLEVRMFWEDLFERMPVTTIQRVLNKLSVFLLPEKICRIFSQRENKIDFRKIIDERKIFLAPLPAGLIGSDCTNVLGSTLESAFNDAGMSRANIPPNQRVPFNLYIDEFHRFALKSFEDSLRELRKYNVRLILAYQQREGIQESIRKALGNVGTKIVFDVDWKDAQAIHKEFCEEVGPHSLMRKGSRQGYVEMFGKIANFYSIERPKKIGEGYRKQIIEQNLAQYYVPIKNAVKNRINSRKKRTKNEVLYDEI